MINNTIFSKSNKKIQALNKLLKSKKERIQNNKVILLGEKVINAYLENSIEKSIDVFTYGEEISENILKNSKVELFKVDKKLKKIFDHSDGKYIGIAEKPNLSNKLSDLSNMKRVLVLLGIQDPGNLGNIIRSAIAFNFKDIVISNDSCDVWSPKCLRGSMGAHFNANIINLGDVNELNNLELDKYLFVSSNQNSINLSQIITKRPYLCIFGNETHGITKYKNIENLIRVTIPINKGIESLNVSNACAVSLYHLNCMNT